MKYLKCSFENIFALALIVSSAAPQGAWAEMTSLVTSYRGGVQTKRLERDGVLVWRAVTNKGKTELTLYDPDGIPRKTVKALEELSEEEREGLPQVDAAFEESGEGASNSKAAKAREEKLALLRQYDPNGASIIEALKDKSTFDFFSSGNGTPADELDTGVHESLHGLDDQLGDYRRGKHAFRLIGGKVIYVPMRGTFNRDQVATLLSERERGDGYAQTYLTGASGRQGLHMLLEELNAYTQGGLTGLRLSEGMKEQNRLNPGLQHMMFYLGLYLKLAREKHVKVHDFIIKNEEYRGAIQTLWIQAEDVLNQSCASSFVSVDPEHLLEAYRADVSEEMSRVLGRKVSLPVECAKLLESDAPVREAQGDQVEGDATADASDWEGKLIEILNGIGARESEAPVAARNGSTGRKPEEIVVPARLKGFLEGWSTGSAR